MEKDSLVFGGVLFDMDGTLIDTEPLWQAAERSMMSKFDVDWTPEDQEACHGGSTIRVTNYMADLVAASGQPRPDSALFAEGFEQFMLDQLTSKPPQLLAGARPLLEQVRAAKLPVALVSSSQRVLMNAVLASIGDQWFDHTVSADDVSRHKPDPLPYLQGAAAIRIAPTWCVAIEDSPTGVASATEAGAFVVALSHAASFEPASRRVVVDSLAEVSLADLDSWFVPPA